ncbi:hypothetical protein O6H91_12G059900 [Diphasiastrum complanatum]|uniref:Uncharacterized protein n=1 Tax=Diphasiastrum complanatum TaxID=34168 RepID=A0ACC2C2H8_DIPCM|nr:hypothetical protein O6H91_12G059900 [Diphasiastrum complanatum]
MSITNAVYVAWPLPAACPLRVTSSLEGCSTIISAPLVTSACPPSNAGYTILPDVFTYSGRLFNASSLGLRSIRRGSREVQWLNSRQRGRFASCWCQGQTDRSGGEPTWNDNEFGNDWTKLTEDTNNENGLKDGDSQGGKRDESSSHNLAGHRKQMQAAVARLGDPLRDMVSSASKKLQNYFDNYQNSKIKHQSSPDQKPEESERDRWQEVFADADEQENLASVLRFQLEEAVENEDFQEAARLKLAVSAVDAKNTVTEAFNKLKKALDEERYSDAARLRDEAGAGLVGWWSGISEGGSDPFGQIINVSPAQGRLVARSYTARQLITAAPGIPLFEVFVTKDDRGVYHQQAVCLRRDGHRGSGGPVKIEVVSRKSTGNQGQEITKEVLEVLEDGKEPNKDVDSSGEPLSRLLSFLKAKIPDVKLKVFQVIAPEGAEADLPKIVRQLMEQDDEGKEIEKSLAEDQEITEIKEISIENGSDIPNVQQKEDGNTALSEEDLPFSLVVSAGSQSSTDDKPPMLPVRVLAKIEHKTKDMFVIHVDDPSKDEVAALSPTQAVQAATTSNKMSADSETGDIVKILTNSEKVPVKEDTIRAIVALYRRAIGRFRVSGVISPEVDSSIGVVKHGCPLSPTLFGLYIDELEQVIRSDDQEVLTEMGEIIKLAVSHAQRKWGLSRTTSYSRIDVAAASTDSLNGLYVGAFGPYTSEVVQLRRKYGYWHEGENSSTDLEKLDFFEYVEAVKLTGDLSVPAGQVTFRAKVGRGNRLSHRFVYPEELGVIARYKGQGRMAEPGFRNPQWVDGELVLLKKKTGGLSNGAELGFVYSINERHILVLFNRLNLQN